MDYPSIKNYKTLKKLGDSPLGSTFLIEHELLKKQAVLKIFPSDLANEVKDEFLKKLPMLSACVHPHVVQTLDAFIHDDQLHVITEAILKEDEGVPCDLQSLIHDRGVVLNEKQIVSILHQVADAVDYIHDFCSGPHQNIKPRNVLVETIKEDSVAVFVTDSGYSQILGTEYILKSIYSHIGATSVSDGALLKEDTFWESFSAVPPETRKSLSYDLLSDVYTFGMLGFYLHQGEYPTAFFHDNDFCDFEYAWPTFFKRCLAKKPEERPASLSEALSFLFENSKKDLNTIVKSIDRHFIAPSASDATGKPIIKPQEIRKPVYDKDPGAVFNKESSVAVYKPKTQKQKTITPLPTEMVIIPEGSYTRGSLLGARDERPPHTVHIASFALDLHPVTNEHYIRFLEFMGGEKDGDNSDMIGLKESRVIRSNGKYMIESGYEKHPVTGVTWYGAQAYAKWVGKRLPYETEWEIAAKGDHDEAIYPNGDTIDKEQANFFSSDTTEVQKYPANSLGIYDLSGNVYEWCEDWYDFNYYHISHQEPSKSSGPKQGVYRVLRGGCWKSLKDDLRVSHRHRNSPGSMNKTYGFRCAADVQ